MIEITGVRQLDRKLRKLPKTLQKKALRKATREVAKMTLRDAKQEVPHDTGALEASLKVRAGKRSRRRKDEVRHNVVTDENVERLNQGDQFYAHFLEFGTKPRVTRAGYFRGAIQPRRYSFLRPALYAHRLTKRLMFITEVSRWLRQQKEQVRRPR